MDREDKHYLLAIWLVLATVLAIELTRDPACHTDSACEQTDDNR